MEALAKAIEQFNGVSALARALGVRQSVVSNWRMRNKVPAERCHAIETLTAGAVTCRDLRPDVFGAPAPATREAD
jgi:DNA-binding transcriptional regulator YdaS (Cro superfamily)